MNKKNTTDISRRNFLTSSLLITGGVFLAPILDGCKKGGDVVAEAKTTIENAPAGLVETNFNYGVASFDPTDTSIILWTKYAPTADDRELVWELSLDNTFAKPVLQGKVNTDAGSEDSVRVIITGLKSNTKYHYRFYNVASKAVSIIGDTLTFPSESDAAPRVKLAVCSCSNFPAGLFNVYKDMANSDADVIVHLGDYIYEYGPNEFGTNDYTASLHRIPNPKKDTVTLDEYRTRYKQYRGDENLKLAHQKKPFICVWDDHEFANNAYKDGAENHQPDEGSFEARKMSAEKAYSEYIPVRTDSLEKIYRTITIGNLVSLHMLDTRIIGRDKQLSYSDPQFQENGAFSKEKFEPVWNDTNRKMMGDEQMQWFQMQVSNSKAKWQVLGQQVLMTKMKVPADVAELIDNLLSGAGLASLNILDALFKPDSPSGKALAALNAVKAIALKRRQDKAAPLTDAETKLLSDAETLPYNLDAWDGYPAERERLYAILKGKNVIALAGDSHNGWQGDLVDDSGTKIGTEFAGSSITSPGIEVYLEKYLGVLKSILGDVTPAELLLTAVKDLRYCNLTQRGYVMATFTPASATGEWLYVDNVNSNGYGVNYEHTITVSSLA